MRFVKMHGLGNDYVIVEGDELSGTDRFPDLARRISDRHLGIGSDGLIVLDPSASASTAMRIFNADGSPGGMCGNGLRCVGAYLHARGRVPDATFVVSTESGEVEVRIDAANGPDFRATTMLPAPIFAPERIPVAIASEKVVDYPVSFAGEDLRVTCVSMGNPHCIVPSEDLDERRVKRLGAEIERNALFPQRTNVSFVTEVGERQLRQCTWERGSGLTRACGSGAAASVVAWGERTGVRGPFEVRMDGGTLEVEWRADGRVAVCGPAVEVFRGEWGT